MAPTFARVGQEMTPKLTSAKYASVPLALRDTLRAAFEKACSKYTAAALETRAATYSTQYEVKKALLFRWPKRPAEIITIKTGFAFAEAANIALLDLAIDEGATNLAELTAVKLESSLAELELANPDALDLHTLRKGDLGWGFDTFGCLSVCSLAELGSKELRLEAYFVQRVYGSGGDGPRFGGVPPSADDRAPAESSGFKFAMKLPGGLAKGDPRAEDEEDEEDEDVLGKLREKEKEKEEAEKRAAFEASLLRRRDPTAPRNPFGFQGMRY